MDFGQMSKRIFRYEEFKGRKIDIKKIINIC